MFNPDIKNSRSSTTAYHHLVGTTEQTNTMSKANSCKKKPVLSELWNEMQVLCLTHRMHCIVLLLTLLLTLYQFSYYKHSTCMALLSFNNLCLFNLFRVVCHMCGLWADGKPSTPHYSYGLARVRVLVVFSGLVLMVMLACWSLKVMMVVWLVGVEGELYYGCSSSGNALLLGLEVVVLTGIISATGSGAALDGVVKATTAAPSSTMTLVYRLTKQYLPTPLRWKVLEGVSLLRRVWWGGPLCPVLVLALTCWLMLVVHTATAALIVSISSGSSSGRLLVSWCDAMSAISTLLLTASYLRQPLLVTPRTLMQGVVLCSGALQRSLHQAATIDGVLEVSHARVRCLAPHCLQQPSGGPEPSSSGDVLSGSVLVRLQRDAEAAAVVRQLQSCLQQCVQHLTLQVYKDDWLQPSVPLPLPQTSSLYNIPANGVGRYTSTITSEYASSSVTSSSTTVPEPSKAPQQQSLSYTMMQQRNFAQYPDLIRSAVTSSHSPHYVNINLPIVSAQNNASPVRSFSDKQRLSNPRYYDTNDLCNITQISKTPPEHPVSSRIPGENISGNASNAVPGIESQDYAVRNSDLEYSSQYPYSVAAPHNTINSSTTATTERGLDNGLGNSLRSADISPNPQYLQNINRSQHLANNPTNRTGQLSNPSSSYPMLPANGPVNTSGNLYSNSFSIIGSGMTGNNSVSGDSSSSSGKVVGSSSGYSDARYTPDNDDHSYVNIDYSKSV